MDNRWLMRLSQSRFLNAPPPPLPPLVDEQASPGLSPRVEISRATTTSVSSEAPVEQALVSLNLSQAETDATTTESSCDPIWPLPPERKGQLQPLDHSQSQLSTEEQTVSNVVPPTKEAKKEQAPPEEPNLLLTHKSRVIEYLGHRRRIIMQDNNGPCSLLAICNHLSLKGKINLLDQTSFSDDILANLVYDEIFKLLEEHEVIPMIAEVKKLTKGLDLSVSFNSSSTFDDSLSLKIFRLLDIPLYHGWLLDPEKDAQVVEAIGGRSYDALMMDIATHESLNHTLDPRTIDQCDNAYKLIKEFLVNTSGQLTSYGLSCLQNKDVAERELFVLFRNNHFSICYKKDGHLYDLQTDEGFLTGSHYWQRIDDVHGGGSWYASRVFGRPEAHHTISSASSDLRSAKDFQKKTPEKRPSSLESRFAKGLVMSNISSSKSSSRSITQTEIGASSNGMVQLEDLQKQHGQKFRDFLKGYHENGVLYYKEVVRTMSLTGSCHMFVQHCHIRHYNPQFAQDLCLSYKRVRKHLCGAAASFIEGFKEEFGFECKRPIVHISDLPKTALRWKPLKEFMKLHIPAYADYIFCDSASVKTCNSTPIGRVVLNNILVELVNNHVDGHSRNGEWTADDVMVSDELDIDIRKPYVCESTRSAMHNDFVTSVEEVIPLYVVQDLLPGFFEHLSRSLTVFIPADKFNQPMLRKFRRFITTHQALRPPLANLSFFDDVYTMHQSLSPKAKAFMQHVLNTVSLQEDWRAVLMSHDETVAVPRVLTSVYAYNKARAARKAARKADQAKAARKASLRKTVGQTSEGDNSVAVQGAAKVSVQGAAKVAVQGAAEGPPVVAPEPFVDTVEGQMLYARMVRHHGSKGSKDEQGRQTMRKLSCLYKALAHYFWTLPTTMERLIMCADVESWHVSIHQAYFELMEMLEEILESYNRPELPQLKFARLG